MKSPSILFSANGAIGRGIRGETTFPTCESLLAHMDRLGIGRSLVWSQQARDMHPATGNARLLEEWKGLGERGRRLVPALAIAPSMLHENRSVEELCGLLRSGVTRALWMFPTAGRFKLRHIEPLVERLLPFKPVLFVPVPEVAEDRDLAAFAETFPQTPLVCMYGMWQHLLNYGLLDVLRRRPNVLLDNSWMHTHGTLEKIVRDFGPGRVVFSAGTKAQNGASISHLQHAEVPDEAREAVAHGNLERLLGLEPSAPVAPAAGAGSLWPKMRSGARPPVEIVDAHGHLGSIGIWPIPERGIEEQIPAAIRRMDALGIRTMIVSGVEALYCDSAEGNALLETLASGQGDRIQGYLAYNPYYEKEMSPRLDEFLSRRFFVGFKTLCDYWGVPVTDKRFDRIYRYAHEHRMPILLHTWEGACNAPALLKDIVKEYPEAVFILGHSGGGDAGRRQAEALAADNPNVFLEFCGSFCASIPWEETLPRVGAGRVVFGTDAMGHDFAWELGRFLSIDLPAEMLLPALGENVRGILARRR